MKIEDSDQGDASLGVADEGAAAGAGVDTPEAEADHEADPENVVNSDDPPSETEEEGSQQEQESHSDGGDDGDTEEAAAAKTATITIPSKPTKPTSLDYKNTNPDGSKRTTPVKEDLLSGPSSSLLNGGIGGGMGGAGSRSRTASSGAANAGSESGSGSANPYLDYLNYADMENMDEEAILQALYDNPELSAAAREANDAATDEERAARRERMRLREEAKAREGGGERYYRTADGKIKKVGSKPDYVEILKEEGVPVKSWIVIGALSVFGLYQLRKSLKDPSVEAKARGKREKTPAADGVSGGKKRGGGKQKGKRGGSGKSKSSGGGKKGAEGSMSATTKTEVPQLTKETVPENVTEKVQQKPAPKKKVKKKKTKKPAAVKEVAKTETEDDADSDQSTDGSSSSAPAASEQPPKKETDASGPGTMLHNYDEEDRRAIMQVLTEDGIGDDEEGEWQTAGRKSKKQQPPQTHAQSNGEVAVPAGFGSAAVEDTASAKPEIISASDGNGGTKEPASDGAVPPADTSSGGKAASNVSEQINEPSADATPAETETKPTQPEPESAGKENESPELAGAATEEAADVTKDQKTDEKPNGKKKGKPQAKVTKPTETSSSDIETSPKPSSPPPQSTDDDAALARMLQMQEETMAAQGAEKAEESWEEVTTKKKKRAAAAAATAAAAEATMAAQTTF